MKTTANLRESEDMPEPEMIGEEKRDPKMKEREEMEKAASMRKSRDIPRLMTRMEEERNIGMKEEIKVVMIGCVPAPVTSKEEERNLETEEETEERKGKEAEWMWIPKQTAVRKTQQDLADLTEIDSQGEVSYKKNNCNTVSTFQ